MNLSKRLVTFFVTIFLLAAIPQLQAQSLTDLGDFGGGVSIAYGINDSDQVVGTAATSITGNAFLYSDGTMTDLGTSFGNNNSGAMAINDLGQITGSYSLTQQPPVDGQYDTYAFLYSGGTMTILGTLGGNYTVGNSINNSGQIAGTSSIGGIFYPYLYSGGTMTNLGTLGGYTSLGQGINNSGQIVGFSTTTIQSTPQIAYLYSGGTMTGLGTLGGTNSSANAINDLGQIVGTSNLSNGNPSAFLYSGGTMINLGSLGGGISNAVGINNAGQVVGQAYTSDNNAHAFVYSTSTGMQDLNTLYASLLVSGTDSKAGFTSLTVANGINNSGDIVGQGTYWNGTSSSNEAFLLIAPEPSTWAMLFGGCAFLVLLRLRRTRKS